MIGSFLGDALGASRPTVTGIAPGVYRYRMSTYTLRTVPDAAPEELAQAYEQPEFAERAAASLLLTVELGRAVTRYGARHYRVLHTDGSIATQDLYLVSTALDLACCAVAGFAEAPPRGVARDQAARPAVPDRMAPLITGWLLGHRSESCRRTGC